MVTPGSLCLVVVAFGVCTNAQGAFYPFGSAAGDTFLPHPSDPVQNVTLLQPFPYFNQTYQQVYVVFHGYLNFFEPPTTQDFIFPIRTTIDYSERGNISYQQYTTGDVLTTATRDINSYFPKETFTASWVFVATWDRVVHDNNNASVTNDQEATFQVVLISDGAVSFVLLNYGVISPPPLGRLQVSYTRNELGLLDLNPSCFPNDTIDAVSLKTSSNVNVAGRWVIPASFQSDFSCSYPSVQPDDTPGLDYVVGMRLMMSSSLRLNETGIEDQILPQLREFLRQRGVNITGIRLRSFYEKLP
ncbi:sushi, nidogen and EGF-like domain-containing protein 1 [Engraulis encrasicolus]|uniref:sushi, nidogen and EGF-like domain-containing protein 1 n=1 Tax=Engraulis encrasicolus TaxID=184585 RepID=UPI002FD23E99